jgi:hypothetical protein
MLAAGACGLGTQLVSGQCVPIPDAGAPKWPRFEQGIPYCGQGGLASCPFPRSCQNRGDGVWVCMGSVGKSGEYCVDSGDCEFARSCDLREDGLKVCMGEGLHGDSCQTSSDCEFPGSCKDRGDGVHVCMDDGPRGSFCVTSSDCVFPLSCYDRGDGLKSCM